MCVQTVVRTQDQAFSGTWESKLHHCRRGGVSADKIASPGGASALFRPCFGPDQSQGTIWEPAARSVVRRLVRESRLSACIFPALPCGQSANRLLSKETCVAISHDYYMRSLQPLPPDAEWLPMAQIALYSLKDPTGISLYLLRLSGS